MTELLFDIMLSGLLLMVGAWCVFANRMTTSVIIFITYGLLLSIAWVRIAAIDVALTEAAIGTGATGMLLIMAAYKVSRDEERVSSPNRGIRLATGALATLAAGGVASLAFLLPGAPVSLADLVMSRLPESGLGNPVAGVLFVYRSFDTLLEKVVLLLALLGVWSLAKDADWGKSPALKQIQQPHSVLLLLARILPPIGIVYAVYMTWAGADVPGGAFQGGTVLAAMWVLAIVAGIGVLPRLSSLRLRTALVAGPAVFVAIGFVGFLSPGQFLAYPEGFAKPLIVVMEVALAVSIAATLALLIAGPSQSREAQ